MIIPDLNLLIYSVNEQSPFHNEAREWWENQHKRVLSGEQFLVEYQHEQDDGTVLYFEVAYNPIRKNEEIVICSVGFSDCFYSWM